MEDEKKETHTVWVGNISDSITEDVLRSEFECYGPIANVKIDKSKDGRTIAFINFYDKEVAQATAHDMNGSLINGVNIKTSFKQEGHKAKDIRRLTDCQYFMQRSSCRKAEKCLFRHSEAARQNRTVCNKWKEHKCTDQNCEKRHPSSSKEQDNDEVAGVYWDIENCQLPSRVQDLPHLFVEKIRTEFLQGKKLVEFICCCDNTKIQKSILDGLSKAGVSMLHTSATAKNAADEKLKQQMQTLGHKYQNQATVILISGDANFAPTLTNLRYTLGVHVVLLHNQQASNTLTTLANEKFHFGNFVSEIVHKITPNHSRMKKAKSLASIKTQTPVAQAPGDRDVLLPRASGRAKLRNQTPLQNTRMKQVTSFSVEDLRVDNASHPTTGNSPKFQATDFHRQRPGFPLFHGPVPGIQPPPVLSSIPQSPDPARFPPLLTPGGFLPSPYALGIPPPPVPVGITSPIMAVDNTSPKGAHNYPSAPRASVDAPPPKAVASETFPVWVGNISDSTTENVLRSKFEGYGLISSVNLLPESKFGRKCGFVNFCTKDAAEDAATEMNGSCIDGVKIKTSLQGQSHKPKDVRPLIDCRFFMEGKSCTKECRFRHHNAAKRSSTLCEKWLNHQCGDLFCGKRHPRQKKKKSLNFSGEESGAGSNWLMQGIPDYLPDPALMPEPIQFNNENIAYKRIPLGGVHMQTDTNNGS